MCKFRFVVMALFRSLNNEQSQYTTHELITCNQTVVLDTGAGANFREKAASLLLHLSFLTFYKT